MTTRRLNTSTPELLDFFRERWFEYREVIGLLEQKLKSISLGADIKDMV
jgi:hypothetical protein